MLDESQLRAILELGGEPRSAEFKGPGSISDKRYVAKVARAAIALANYRGGGSVILGVIDANPLTKENGLTAQQVLEWTDSDLVNAKINTYADPALELQLTTLTHPAGGALVVVQVQEFRDLPIMCKRDYGDILSEGQLYTRSSAKTESSSRQTHGEMREVIELAVDKNLQRFLERSLSGGLSFTSGATVTPTNYAKQVEAADRSGEPIEGPYFHFSIRPNTFRRDRFNLGELRNSILRSEVRHWGWAFPTTQFGGQGQDWIAGGQSHGTELEKWRYYRSGQFTASVAIYRGEKDRLLQLSPDQAVTGYIPVYQPVILFSMLLEFAARLQAETRGEEDLLIGIEAHGIEGFALSVSEPPERGFWNLYQYSDKTLILDEIALGPGTAIADTRAVALTAAATFFHHFGWLGANPQVLETTQARVMSS